MLIVIDALNADRFAPLLDDMFRLRARVFGDRMGWEVAIENGREIDCFDSLDPAYIVGLDEGGDVVSCLRLLQTTGPHMLADVFDAILDGQPPIRSARVWESTRFCVDTARLKERGDAAGISRVTCELLTGLTEYCMTSGISDIITVIDPVMDRVLKRSAYPAVDYVGRRVPMGKVDALAALYDCTEARVAAVRAFGGIEGPVFLEDEAALELFANHHPAPLSPPLSEVSATLEIGRAEILAYCRDQLAAARTPSERAAARQVAQALLAQTGLPQDALDTAQAVLARPLAA